MKFEDHKGAFICPHIFDNTRPILLVIHEEGDWQCLCGLSDHNEIGRLVGIGHLVKRDPSIDEVSDLPDGWEAERKWQNEAWIRRKSS
jgi:hypothetical protein